MQHIQQQLDKNQETEFLHKTITFDLKIQKQIIPIFLGTR